MIPLKRPLVLRHSLKNKTLNRLHESLYAILEGLDLIFVTSTIFFSIHHRIRLCAGIPSLRHGVVSISSHTAIIINYRIVMKEVGRMAIVYSNIN